MHKFGEALNGRRFVDGGGRPAKETIGGHRTDSFMITLGQRSSLVQIKIRAVLERDVQFDFDVFCVVPHVLAAHRPGEVLVDRIQVLGQVRVRPTHF